MARTTQERKRARSKADDARESADEVRESGGDTQDGDEAQDGGSSGGVFSELKNVASDAALGVLAPVAREAAVAAAKYAVKKGPDLIEDTVKPMLEDAGGVKGLAAQLMPDGGGGLLSKMTPGGGDEGGGGAGAGDGTGKGRRMPVQQSVDIAAPIDAVYDQWTQFEDYPKFMHRLQRVEQRDDARVAFHAKVWGINRMWEAEIVEQRPDERILFKSVNGVQLTGVVTFHELSERLTRVELNVDLDPDGPIEKFARGARFVKRATRGDLKRFKAFVEMREEETGAWRGEIDDGDVVSESDERYEDEYDDYDEDDEPVSEQDDEPAAEEDDDLAEEEDEDEAEPEREPARAKSSSGGSKRKRSSSRSRGGSTNGGSPKRSRASSGGKSSSRGKSSKRSRA